MPLVILCIAVFLTCRKSSRPGTTAARMIIAFIATTALSVGIDLLFIHGRLVVIDGYIGCFVAIMVGAFHVQKLNESGPLRFK